MKNTKKSVKKGLPLGVLAGSAPPDKDITIGLRIDNIDPFDTGLVYYPPLVTPEEQVMLDNLAKHIPWERKSNPPAVFSIGKEMPEEYVTGYPVNNRSPYFDGTGLGHIDNKDAWIQTSSGRRFSPTNPDYKAIVLQDIAQSLSMQCRFSGHSKKFYSVGQHSVLVSYICDSQDALWGLLHDASEAYCVDVPRPLKRSGMLGGYIEIEGRVQQAVCLRFNLPSVEPHSVKKADSQLLATEARDLMMPLHVDWIQPVEPLPFIIEPWSPEKTKEMFIRRFFELTGAPESHLRYYLEHKDSL